jgi:hypothetical protein
MYQQDNFLDNFDLGLFTAPDNTGLTSDVAFMQQHAEGPAAAAAAGVAPHQTLAERMQGDKQDTLLSMR